MNYNDNLYHNDNLNIPYINYNRSKWTYLVFREKLCVYGVTINKTKEENMNELVIVGRIFSEKE